MTENTFLIRMLEREITKRVGEKKANIFFEYFHCQLREMGDVLEFWISPCTGRVTTLDDVLANPMTPEDEALHKKYFRMFPIAGDWEKAMDQLANDLIGVLLPFYGEPKVGILFHKKPHGSPKIENGLS